MSTVWDQQRLIEALRASQLLGELTEAQISQLAGRAHFELRKVGDMLVKKGDPSHQFDFICEGQVRIVDEVNGRSKVVCKTNACALSEMPSGVRSISLSPPGTS